MNIQAEKIEIMKLILATDDLETLKNIKNIFKKDTADFWESLSDEQKEDVLLGVEEIQNGESVTYESFINRHKK